MKVGAGEISLELSCKADPALYDLPLTLSTQVPADWKECAATQGAGASTVPVRDGVVQYDALPNGGTITFKKAG
ncbi:hypothetical protein [Prosthecobacter sp.]|uniref:hypothetical protein n=1 Tax=Prosthecobacter sp. TaxID=1965333 RepID=UPI003783A457